MAHRLAHPRVLVRPVAVLAAGLLVAGVVQTGPALADPGDPPDGPAVSITVEPASGTADAGTGSDADHPADLGPMPGSLALRATVTNTGDETLTALSVTSEDGAGGPATGITCTDADGDTLTGSVELLPGSAVSCTGFGPSGVMDDGVDEDVTSVTALGSGSGTPVSAAAHFYATATDGSVKVGDRVWRDTDRDGVQDPGEPGIGGVRLTVTGPDGLAVPDAYADGQVVGPQTTASDGSYTFTHLAPLPAGSRYTVTVDTTSAALAGLDPTTAGAGDPAQDSSTGSAASSGSLTTPGATDLTLDFGFVAHPTPPVTPPPPSKAPVALTAQASPSTAVKGTTITVKGTLERSGKGYEASTVLELRRDGASAWTKVKNVTSSSKGALSTSVEADRSGSFRFRYAGSSTTASGASAGAHVTVRKATVRLTVDAPGSVTKGKSIKVKGSLKREGKKYKATTVLEFRAGGGSWSKVKSVRSSSKGALSTTVKPSRTGDYRYRFAGNTTTDAGTSRADHVTVKPKPPSKPKPKTYANCTALRKVYPHGVGKSGAKDKTASGSDPVTNFVRDTKTYDLNKKSDRDKDGIACEQH